MRKISINQEQAYLLLNRLVNAGYLLRLYEFRCPIGGHTEILEENYVNLPNTINCIECHEEFTTRDHLFMVYEVRHDS